MSRPKESKNSVIHIWTVEEKDYLKQITPGHHHKEIQELMNEKFGLGLTLNQIKSAIKRYKLNTGFTGKIEKGNIPYNKGKKGIGGWEPTQFRKGHKPHNYVPVGSERINTDGYHEIKIADPNKWEGKHILMWEEHNGPIPKGYAVIFGDGNKLNLKPDNLILVSRRQLLILNRNKLIQDNADLTRTGIIIADVYQKINEIRKKSK